MKRCRIEGSEALEKNLHIKHIVLVVASSVFLSWAITGFSLILHTANIQFVLVICKVSSFLLLRV